MTTQGLSRGPDKEAVREWAEMGLVIPQPTACRGVRRKSPDLDLRVRQEQPKHLAPRVPAGTGNRYFDHPN